MSKLHKGSGRRAAVLAAVAALALSTVAAVAPQSSLSSTNLVKAAALVGIDPVTAAAMLNPVTGGAPPTPARAAPPVRNEPAEAAKATRLPEARVDEVTLGRAAVPSPAGQSGVSIAAADAVGAGKKVRVQILDPAGAAGAGTSGFAFTVAPVGAVSGVMPVVLTVDYAPFAERFGAGYADRLRITSDKVALNSRNDRTRAQLVAEIADLGSLAGANGTAMFTVSTEPEGEEGSFKATPLSVSGDWQVNLASGDFTYRYDIPLAPAPAGPTPQVGLRYSSAGVDGMVSGRNTQSGQVGLGWSGLADSFVERRYGSCLDDGQVYADLCWKSDNATLSLNGRSSELVAVTSSNPKQWRLRDDPRWRIEQLTGAPNGDDNGEHWKVTSPDGVIFYFGRGENPDVGVETHSVWTVPVFGDDAGEPCSTNTPVAWCPQAWRWNLDLVIDPHDNVQQWEYIKEVNHYAALNGWPGFEHTEYVRSGVLRNIKYGKRRVETDPAAAVEFEVAYRCAGLQDDCPAPTVQTAASFPDTPVDLMCFAAPCAKHSPTFFTALRYYQIHAKAVDNNDNLVDVDQIRLAHAFPDPDPARPGDQKLVLTGIQRTGMTAAKLPLPPVTFSSVLLNNRLDVAAGQSAMPHYRVSSVINEYGGETLVSYGQPHQCLTPLPNPPNWDLNTRNCFPHWHSPAGGAPGFAIFHKYVVTKVEQRDRTGGGVPIVTDYLYGDKVAAGLPNGAWHHDRDEFVPNSRQSWSEWRGYADVLVRQGDSRTQYRFYRGMNADRLAGDPFPGPGSRVARVSSLDGTVSNVLDSNWLAGRVLDDQSLRVDGAVLSGVVHGYHAIRTVDAPGPDPLDDTWFVQQNDVIERRLNTANGSFVRRRTQTVFNAVLGTPDQVIEHGWTNATGDERCTRTDHLFNLDRWMLDFAWAVTRYANTTCTGTEVTRIETAYDGAAYGVAPAKGDKTSQREKIDSAPSWATSTSTYDSLGRALVITDPNGHTTTTAYSPMVRYPTSITVTNHLGHAQRTDFFRPRQQATSITDERGKKIKFGYDALGRKQNVYRPTEQGAGSPASYEFSYVVDPNRTAPSVVLTRQLQDIVAGVPRYLEAWELQDSFLRQRQTHVRSAAAGKTIVTDVTYDNRGLVAAESKPQAVNGVAGAALLPAPSGQWDNVTRTAYSELGKPIWELFYAASTVARSTVIAYNYNSSEVTPTVGGKTRTITDAYDRTTQVQEHDGTAYRTATMTYDADDRLVSLVDPAGNTSGYTYDMVGRRKSMTDLDAGNRSYAYDPQGNQTRVTDATGVQVHTKYDALDRPTELRKDSLQGQLLATWSYDAPGEPGLLDKSTRVTAAGTWTVDITGYDDRNRRLGVSWNVPAGVAGLAGTYSVTYGYDAADHRTSVSYPAAGGLPAETVLTAYSPLGLPATMAAGGTQYVHAAGYDDRNRPTLFGFGSAAAQTLGKAWAYNANQELSQLVAIGPTSTTIQNLRLTYDAMGNVTERQAAIAGQSWRECFGHDLRHRLTAAFTTTGNCATGTKGSGANPYQLAYTYTVDGNLKTRTEGTAVTIYSYPAVGAPRPHAPTAVGANTYVWNANGNLASRTVSGQTETFSWDAEQRLSAITDPDGNSSFVYDADGSRLMRQDVNGTTVYFDGHEVTAKNGVTTAVRSYTFGDHLVASRTASGVDYLVTDNQGSVQVSVPAGTATATVRTYQPYGRARHTGQHDTDRGWIGQIEDRATQLSYLNARYFDPSVAVFLSADPVYDIARPKTLNPYSYGDNNPVSTSDPLGLDPPCYHPDISCSAETRAGQLSALTPNRTYDEVLAQIRANDIADDTGGAQQITEFPDGPITVTTDREGMTEDELKAMVGGSGLTANVAGLGLKLVDKSGEASISKIIGTGGKGADVLGVVLECSDKIDGPCAWAGAVAIAGNIPYIKVVVISLQVLDTTNLGHHYVEILNDLFNRQPQNFGTVLQYDTDVIAEYGRPVTETGNQNPHLTPGGFAPAPGGEVVGGDCPLRGCDDFYKPYGR